MENKKVWLVTGASKGLGLTLVTKLLAAGYRVAATSRNREALIRETGGPTSGFLPLQVDLVDEGSVRDAVAETLRHFGTIDVVVNNAGYGQVGTLEEMSDEEIRKNFDVNVFGLVNVIRHVMPHLRTRRSGHLFNIASIGGYFAGFPGWGSYCATKFAVVGLTESLAAEAGPFGVRATVVYPGYFRTQFLEEGSLTVSARQMAEYEEVRAIQHQHQTAINGNQPGDPEKAAEVLIQVAEAPQPPVHLFLGQDAYDMVEVKDTALHRDLEAWRKAATATAFPQENPVAS
ncbi:oxidoreductase [Larkinella soli]|uniref:oxidoreductase n=1 Tax=Larkinella soli TaxID=1770527 RepID=UPI000FFC6AD3|nr:oxidoreductase [Larkinella soli]